MNTLNTTTDVTAIVNDEVSSTTNPLTGLLEASDEVSVDYNGLNTTLFVFDAAFLGIIDSVAKEYADILLSDNTLGNYQHRAGHVLIEQGIRSMLQKARIKTDLTTNYLQDAEASVGEIINGLKYDNAPSCVIFNPLEDRAALSFFLGQLIVNLGNLPLDSMVEVSFRKVVPDPK